MVDCLRRYRVLFFVLVPLSLSVSFAQDKSVKPGINDSFRDPDPKEFQGKFEIESREVFARRKEIVAACQLKPGLTVADIGAGTGLFTRMFSDAVGKDGRIIAVDISQKFLDHIQKTTRESGQQNVEPLLCKADSTELPAESVDVAFICDTYHHFEFPLKTMASLHRALKPGGRVILIDFRRVPGKSTDWVLNHVRAGQEVFESEVVQSGSVVVGVTELSRRSPRFGALLLTLPITSIVAFVASWRKSHDLASISLLARETLILVPLGLPFFVPLAFAQQWGLGFWSAFILGLLLASATIGLWMWLGPSGA